MFMSIVNCSHISGITTDIRVAMIEIMEVTMETNLSKGVTVTTMATKETDMVRAEVKVTMITVTTEAGEDMDTVATTRFPLDQ